MTTTKTIALAGAAILLLSTAAVAADMPTKTPVYKAPASALSWTGFYAGLNAGYGSGRTSTDYTAVDPLVGNILFSQGVGSLPTALDPNSNGFIGGGQFGYNWQLGQTLVGVETDISYSDMQGNAVFAAPVVFGNPPLTTTQNSTLNWLGTFRGRIGWLWTPSTLLYATGGLAYGGVKASTTIDAGPAGTCPLTNGYCSVGSASKTLVGWTIGGGLETAMASNWTAKIEYTYFDLGKLSYAVFSTANFGASASGTYENMHAYANFTGQIVRVGVNYKFGGR